MLQPHPDRRPDSMAAVASWQLGSSGLLRNLKPGGDTRRSSGTAASASRSSGRGLRFAAMSLLLLALLGGAGGGMLYYDPDFFNRWNPFTQPAKVTENPQPPQPPIPPEPKGNEPAPKQRPTTTTNPTPPNPPVTRETSADKIRRYIEQYNGGDCFYAAPGVVRPPFVEIEGFGATTRAFDTLNDVFKRDNGIEADVHVRLITQAQCPAITFLAMLKGDRARAPRIELDSFNLRNGDVLSGLVSGFGNRTVELLLVFDSGVVQNVTNLLKPGTDAKTFAIGMSRQQPAAGAQPQLLLAVTSERPVAALKPPGTVGAEQFFPAVLSEESRTGQALTATAVYFKLDR